MRVILAALLLLIAVATHGQSADADTLKALNAMFIHGSMTCMRNEKAAG